MNQRHPQSRHTPHGGTVCFTEVLPRYTHTAFHCEHSIVLGQKLWSGSLGAAGATDSRGPTRERAAPRARRPALGAAAESRAARSRAQSQPATEGVRTDGTLIPQQYESATGREGYGRQRGKRDTLIGAKEFILRNEPMIPYFFHLVP